MRKIRNYFIYLLVMIMALSFTACGQNGSSDNSGAEDGRHEVSEKVYHESMDVTSTENGNTVSAQALTFNPADGYMPVVYAAYGGWASKLETHYAQAAEQRWGYDVVGIINGRIDIGDGFAVNKNILTNR